MDLKVVCINKDYFFRLGISKVIDKALLSGHNLEFLSGFDSKSLKQADFIIVSVCQWRLYMCQPAYRDRKAGCIILLFVDDVENIMTEKLPVCYRSLIIISRFDSVNNISQKITRYWLENQGRVQGFLPTDCVGCFCARITVVQLQVLSFLKKGYSVRQTAKHLNLSAKTIYAHKYNVMKRFSLKGDMEFNLFINDLSLLELYKGVVSSVGS